MSRPSILVLATVLAVGVLSGCAPSGSAHVPSGINGLLVSDQEAASHGWTATPDSGPVDGDSADCTGATYDWPKVKTTSHASEFLDPGSGSSDSIFVVAKHYNANAAQNVKAVRGALAPCTPASGPRLHGAIIKPLGDDSFAYQSEGKDKTGSFVMDDTLFACGDYEIEAIWMSYSKTVSQSTLESLLAPAVKRMLKAGRCQA